MCRTIVHLKIIWFIHFHGQYTITEKTKASCIALTKHCLEPYKDYGKNKGFMHCFDKTLLRTIHGLRTHSPLTNKLRIYEFWIHSLLPPNSKDIDLGYGFQIHSPFTYQLQIYGFWTHSPLTHQMQI